MRIWVVALGLAAAAGLALACSPPSGDGDADGDLDVDGDADLDAEADGDADLDADADADFDFDFDWDNVCDSQEFHISMEPVRVMILLDQSSSMSSAVPWATGSHWQEATDGLRHMLDDPRNRDFYFGLDAFPDGTLEYFADCHCANLFDMTCLMNRAPRCTRGCAVDLPPIIPLDRTAVSGPQIVDYMSLDYLPGTFTSTPLLRQMRWYDADRSAEMPDFYANDGSSYLVVVSDGDDTCDVSGDPPEAGPVIAELETVTARIRDTYGIRSVAIGFGDTGGTMAAELNAIARAGGTVFTSFFAITTAGALQDALDEIASEIVSCVYDIEEPSATADPDEVNFYFDGEVVGYDPTCTNGWRWTSASTASHPQIEFCGGSCEELTEGEVELIEARFGCATVLW